MSGTGMFEGLADVVRQEEAEAYEPGAGPSYPPDLVEGLVSAFCETEFTIAGDRRSEACFYHSTIGATLGNAIARKGLSMTVDDIFPAVEMFSGFKPQEFLDALVFRLSERGEERHLSHPAKLLSPVLNILHARGYTDLTLNLSPLAAPVLYAGLDLHGSDDNPLKVRLVLPEGTESVIASRCSNADITVLGHPSYLGDGPVRCTLRFPLMKEASISGKEAVVQADSKRGFMVLCPPLPLTLTAVYGNRVAETSFDIGYFSAFNTILVPDGAGGWREVVPG